MPPEEDPGLPIKFGPCSNGQYEVARLREHHQGWPG